MESISKYIEDFQTLITNIRESGFLSINTETLNHIRDLINKIFGNSNCVNVEFNQNRDKQFFGVYVNPTIVPEQLMAILYGDDDYNFDRYVVEIDAKLFMDSLTANEISTIILREVSGMISDSSPVYNLRGIIDTFMCGNDDYVSITGTADSAQLFILAVKDALHKITSCFYEGNDIVNEFIENNKMQVSLLSAQRKILSSGFGLNDTVREPKLILLQWAFSIYQDIKNNTPNAIAVLTDLIGTKGPYCIDRDIKQTIESLKRLSSEVAMESAAILAEARRGGLVDKMKQDGLRAIEDDLYEFRVRAKNAETEDEAMYTLRQINSRINIIEEYLYQNQCTLMPSEIERWNQLSAKYRDLREEISKKTISHKKNYGIWFDYDKI
nr:MAG TPA: hypothetical protein [Caudoviricetes sp.]